MVDLANTVWRDFVTDGVPSSGTHKPKKNDIRQWGTWVESGLNEALAAIGEPKPFVILTSGQSNMAGSGSYSWTPPANLQVWDWERVSNDPDIPGTQFVAPANTVQKVAWALGDCLARQNPLRNVYVINISQAGAEISQWLPGVSSELQDNFAVMEDNVPAALAAIGVDKADIFCWWQGETDAFLQTPDYKGKWEDVHDRIVAEGWIAENTPTAIFGIAPSSIHPLNEFNKMNTVLQDVVAASPGTRLFVNTALLPEDLWADNTHASGPGYQWLGELAYHTIMHGVGAQAGIVVDWETGNRGIGALFPRATWTVSRNATDNTSPVTSGGLTTLLHLKGADDESARVVVDSFDEQASIDIRRANGTDAGKTAITNGQGLGDIRWLGLGSTVYGTGAIVRGVASQDFTDSARGARLEFHTTGSGSTTVSRRAYFQAGLVMDGATGGDKGAGTINATAVYDDNVVLTDLVLDMAVTGSFDVQRYAGHPVGAEIERWWFDPAAYAQFWRENRRLPGVPSWDKPEDRPSTGEMITRLLAQAELQAVLIDNLLKRIEALEVR